MRIHDSWLAQFAPADAAAILTGYSAMGFELHYLLKEACWLIESKPKPKELPN